MKKTYHICLFMLLCLMAFLLILSGVRRKEENLAARIAPEILRFHVLANSDSDEDQLLKLKVKDLLLKNIQANLDDNADRSEVIGSITEHKYELERAAMSYIEEKGYSYPVDIRLETTYFPEKTYGDMTFPAGEYEAVRVLIGSGEGKNFWCVLYPSLCHLDSTHAVVPDSSKEILRTMISEDDFLALLSARREIYRTYEKTEQESLLPHFEIHFKLYDLLCQ